MGKSRRSIACRSMSTAAILGYVAAGGLACGELAGIVLGRDRAVSSGALGGVHLAQVATQLAQLVAQLRGVLEAQLVGSRAHLLLELHDHPLELVLGHLLHLAALGRAPFAS